MDGRGERGAGDVNPTSGHVDIRPAGLDARLPGALPALIDRIEKLGGELGLGGEEIIIRSTGCPNGCARPYMAEMAFVGKAPGRYQLWLGGNAAGTRLNQVFKDTVKDAEIEAELRPILTRWKNERRPGERFGDFCSRVVLPEQKTAGAAIDAAPAPISP